jgi:microsomal dipeptidase-like Zn-dependent dipeptidase
MTNFHITDSPGDIGEARRNLEEAQLALIAAKDGIVRAYAYKAYCDLDNLPEFGEETRGAIVDTAADALADAGFGYLYDRARLREIAKELA